MKKNYFASIIFGFIFLAHPVLAQEGLVNCGFAEINLSALLAGTQSPESIPELVCLGEKILTKDSSAKVILGTPDYGKVEFYIERGSENQVTGKITIGKVEDMVYDEQKVFAGTFFSCPSDIVQIESKNTNIDYLNSPGALVLASYLEFINLAKDPEGNSCVGTYFSASTEEKNTLIDLKTVEMLDKRPLFSDLFSADMISKIEGGFEVLVSGNMADCSSGNQDEESKCVRYFYGSEKNQYDNPIKNLTIRVYKHNQKINGAYSLSNSMIKSGEKFVSLIKNNYTNHYSNITNTSQVTDLTKGKFVLLKNENDRKIIVLKDTWVIEANYTIDIKDKLVSSMINDLSSPINDLVGIDIDNVDMSGLGLPEIPEEDDAEVIVTDEKKIVDEKFQEVVQEKTVVPENKSLLKRLSGKIILKVEENGEAYYIDPTTNKMYYLGRPEDAFEMMRDRGIGITTENISKIPIGFISLTGPDDDEDGLSNIFEDAIKTDKNKQDTDGDTYSDKNEVVGGFDPRDASGKKWPVDKIFSSKQLGKIFLQVEDNGEAWYVNSGDSKRYFLGRPADAFNIMRTLGLGISNKDFASLETAVN